MSEWGNPQQAGVDRYAYSYLAGILDGEGGININYSGPTRDCYRMRVYVVNTDLRLIKWLKSKFGGYIYRRKTKEGYKTKWEWYHYDDKSTELLKECMPYLIVKKEQAELAIAFRDTVNNEHKLSEETKSLRKSFHTQMKSLNKRSWDSEEAVQLQSTERKELIILASKLKDKYATVHSTSIAKV